MAWVYLQILRLEGELGGFLPELPGETAIVGLQFNALLFKPVQLAFQNLQQDNRVQYVLLVVPETARRAE